MGLCLRLPITISTEKQLGTLQNLLLKPVSILQTIINKTLSWIINTVKLFYLTLFALSFFYNVSEIFDLRIFFVFIAIFDWRFWFSLILGALTLMYTKVASFETIFKLFDVVFFREPSFLFQNLSFIQILYQMPLYNQKNIYLLSVLKIIYFNFDKSYLVWHRVFVLSIFKKVKNLIGIISILIYTNKIFVY